MVASTLGLFNVTMLSPMSMQSLVEPGVEQAYAAHGYRITLSALTNTFGGIVKSGG
jgi:hypothetical protein